MKELYPPPLNLHRLYTETQEWEPVLIIISPGADPSQELADLAAETVGRDNYHEVKKKKGKVTKSYRTWLKKSIKSILSKFLTNFLMSGGTDY